MATMIKDFLEGDTVAFKSTKWPYGTYIGQVIRRGRKFLSVEVTRDGGGKITFHVLPVSVIGINDGIEV